MHYLLYLLFLHRFADFAFYKNGSSLFIVGFLGFFALIYLLTKYEKFSNIYFLLTSIFFFILLLLNVLIAKNLADSFIYIVLLISLVFLFFYLVIKGVAFKFLDTLFLIGLINIFFVIIEAFLKLSGYANLEIIPFSFYINDRFNLGGIFYQPSLNALFLNSTALISLYYLFYNKRTSYRKVFFITIYVISVILSIYTGSRASMLAMCIAIVLFFTIATFKGFDFGFRNRLVLIFCTYLALLLVNRFLPFDAAFQNPLTKFHLQGSEDFSIISRFNIWFAQILIFLDNPFFGVGLDNFKYISALYQLESIRLLNLPYSAIGNFTFGHNEFLQLLCEGGLFLIIPLLYISFKALKKAVNNINEKNIFLYLIVVIFIIQSMFSWPLRHPALMLYFVVVIACLASNLETFSLKTGLIKKISYFSLSLFLIIYITFFISFGKAIALELYYIPKAKNSSNFFHSLTYVDKLSKNPFLKYGANHLFVQKAFNYLWQDIF
ncbi:MAG: O-antigen ligase family protein, partial [Deferribacterota bacterium]|nr:O-antigen ligase family protein [Deferribacterota bacterium]